jgi:hypothetical protein
MKYSSLETKFSSKLLIMDGFVCFIYRNVQLALLIVATNYLFFRNTCKTENTCTVEQKLCCSFHPLVKEGKETETFALEHLLLYWVSRRQELRGRVNVDINLETFHPKINVSIQYLIFCYLFVSFRLVGVAFVVLIIVFMD